MHIVYIYIHPQTKPCASPSLKLSYVTFEICISCRGNAFLLFFPNETHFNMHPPMNLSMRILRGKCSVCDGFKTVMFIFPDMRMGFLRFLMCWKCVICLWLFHIVSVVYGCADFFFIERHVHFAWQALCFAIVEKCFSFSFARRRVGFCVCWCLETVSFHFVFAVHVLPCFLLMGAFVTFNCFNVTHFVYLLCSLFWFGWGSGGRVGRVG